MSQTTTPKRIYPRDLDAMVVTPTRDDIICAAILVAFIVGMLFFSDTLVAWAARG